uniref:Uncharacterized protein n=1 Tax=uncultured Rhodospirillales bacterium HF4000_24M03 TaxID=710788 RepID=E0XW26_9PROT|nr:hypothetical protein [uncultured Rhodospirillales bacterium HF4000_24M03]
MYQYREGKVKSTPMRGVKQILKPDAYKQWERALQRRALLLPFRRQRPPPWPWLTAHKRRRAVALASARIRASGERIRHA